MNESRRTPPPPAGSDHSGGAPTDGPRAPADPRDGAGAPRESAPASGEATPHHPRRTEASPADDPRRTLPKVDVLLAHPEVAARAASRGRGAVLGAVRRVLDSTRQAAAGGQPVPGLEQLAARVAGELDDLAGLRMRAVVNATGVVLHTNLGRAPLSAAAVAAVTE